MRQIVGLFFGIVLGFASIAVLRGEDFRMVRSLSGPSGTVRGSQFVFDETRSRFVHPQDKSFVVYFEWEGPPGAHTLTGLWKRPDGSTDMISPDVKIESTTKELNCYWIYMMQAETIPGVWSLEVRIDGRPAGSHPFEIAGTTPGRPVVPTASVTPTPPSLDQIFREASPSLVWVRPFDGSGRRGDPVSGFIWGKDRVVTTLQVVDGATRLEVEFAGTRRIETDEIVAWSRESDWAVVAVNTGDLPPVRLGDPKRVRVGERQIAFNSGLGVREIGGVDISGIRATGPSQRIQIAPALGSEAIGGPLLDLYGRAVGILSGGAVTGRSNRRQLAVAGGAAMLSGGVNSVTPISSIAVQTSNPPSALSSLIESGAFAAPLFEMEELTYIQTALKLNGDRPGSLPPTVSEFSRADPQVWVISEWMKKGKTSKGFASAKVYDEQNRVRISATAKKTSLLPTPVRNSFRFDPSVLNAGYYRIDLFWEGRPVGRTFIKITD